jgi:hypothetical protein
VNKVNWLKILGIAVLIHIILIVLSVLAVFIYSMVINPGQSKEFYEAFAPKIAPYVSAIGGFILVYFFVTLLNKNKEINPFIIGFGLPIIYIINDFLIIILIMPDWTNAMTTLIISNGMKLLAGIIASYRIKLSSK